MRVLKSFSRNRTVITFHASMNKSATMQETETCIYIIFNMAVNYMNIVRLSSKPLINHGLS